VAIKQNQKICMATKTKFALAWGVLLILVFFAGAALIGFVRSEDAAKSALWGITLGGVILLLGSKLLTLNWHKALWFFFGTIVVIDIAVQGVLRGFFGASPMPSQIAQALANTNSSEIADFLSSQWSSIFASLVYVVIAGACVWLYTSHYFLSLRNSALTTGWSWVVGLLILTVGFHFNPTMLRQEPLMRWAVIYVRHLQAKQEIADADGVRKVLLDQKDSWQVQLLPQTALKKTVVLVIGESANRNNWSWYGYSRPTTAPLEKTLTDSPGRTLRWTQSTSSQAYTLPSLRLALTPLDDSKLVTDSDAWKTVPDIFLLAQAAGYQITWLSNQVAFEGWVSSLSKSATQKAFVNKGNWRDSSSTDFDLLPHLDEVLASPAPDKEFIVLHLLGQHFHYYLRCPNERNLRPFAELQDDTVMRAMQSQRRSAAIRQSRNDYDDAVYCGSVLLSKAMRSLVSQREGRELEFIYFSDHGQEVGHTQNFSGHSETSVHGRTVPLFVWSNRDIRPKSSTLQVNTNELHNQKSFDDNTPYSIDYLDHLLHGALSIKSRWYKPEFDPIFRP
jgi:heptose-I-phosphate ethanolaminephosphotransferase